MKIFAELFFGVSTPNKNRLEEGQKILIKARIIEVDRVSFWALLRVAYSKDTLNA